MTFRAQNLSKDKSPQQNKINIYFIYFLNNSVYYYYIENKIFIFLELYQGN